MPSRLPIPSRARMPAASAVLFTLITLFAATSASAAININVERPGDREFVRDLAGIITSADEQKIKKLCDELLTAKATPIIVVTIPSMAAHGGQGLRIETFATLLFDQWQIGIKSVNKQDWNTGILLLVSTGDRKAQIELGAGWGRAKDGLCTQIMNTLIVPNFKQGKFSAGIVAGVEGLDKMGRDLKIPRMARPWWHYALIVGFIGLAIFTAVSLSKRGSSGWAWLFWGAVFALVGYMLYSMLSNSGNSSGGFSGGSFGGGFSGGGGATGSW
jgi:uncharacterized protein